MGAAEDFYGVREQMRDGIEGLHRTFGIAGKIDDYRFVADDRDTTRKHGGGRFLDALAANLFGETGNGAIADIQRGLGSGIARTKAGAACGEEYVHAAGIGDGAHLTANSRGIIGTAKRGGDDPAEFPATGNKCGAGEVFAFTACNGIADSENGDTHGKL
jgi:hypothetical protein